VLAIPSSISVQAAKKPNVTIPYVSYFKMHPSGSDVTTDIPAGKENTNKCNL